MRCHALGCPAGFTVTIEVVGMALRRQVQRLVGQQQAKPGPAALLIDPIEITVPQSRCIGDEQDHDEEMTRKLEMHGVLPQDACPAG